jgi:hypothetical protein
MFKHNRQQQSGQVLLLTLIFLGLLLTMSALLVGYIMLFVKAERQAVGRAQALQLAEAGVDWAMDELNRNGAYPGNLVPLSTGEVEIAVTALDNTTKDIVSIGYVPNKDNAVYVRQVKVRASVDSSVVSFRFGVQVGNGGATLGNNAQINGNLFSNGNVVGGGSNGAAYVTGDVTVASGTDTTADQEWTVQNSGFNLGDTNAHAALAQGFKPSLTTTLNTINLNLKRVGSPGDIALKIVADNSGKPSNTVLASGSVPASNVSTVYSMIGGNLTTAPALTANTQYWIVAIASVSSSNYYVWGMDSTDAYTKGTGKFSSNWSANNATWTNTGGDLGFQTFNGGADTSLTGLIIGGTAWAHSLNNCQVTGNIFYQVISNCPAGGTDHPGSKDASPASMPISEAQIDAWEAIAEAGGVISGNYSLTGTQQLGPIKIDGDLNVNGTLFMTGPIWVKGDIHFANNSGLIVHSSTGTSGAVIIADYPGSEGTKGIADMSNNMTIAGNGNPGSYPMVLSTNSGANAITMSNNATSVILYASRGTINVVNNAIANQITAYSLNMANNTTVNYVNGLQSESFSNGPGGSWVFVKGTYEIVK